MARWRAAAAGWMIAGGFCAAPAMADPQDNAADTGLPPTASLALSGVELPHWRPIASIDRTLLPAPLQPRLTLPDMHRKLESLGIASGPFQLNLIGSRGRSGADNWPGIGQRKDRKRVWTLASQIGWAVGSGDIASLGVSESVGKISSPYMSGSGRANSRVTTAAFTWRHAQDWVLTLDWQRIDSGHAWGARRLTQLAAGAPLAASGMSLGLSSVPVPLGSRSCLSVGGVVSSDQLQARDKAALSLATAARAAGRLFMRVGF